jgi:hypothetical protein
LSTVCTAAGGSPASATAAVMTSERAAEDAGVAALEAQRRDVDGDVGPALVDRQHHAQRHAHLADLQPVGPAPAVDDLGDRVRLRRHLPHTVGHRGQALVIHGEPIEHGLGQAGVAAGGEVFLIGRVDAVEGGVQGAGDGGEGAVFGGAAEIGQFPTGGARGAGQAQGAGFCGLTGDGHAPRG